jgi:O-antigen/teichoic acid export membrane protein
MNQFVAISILGFNLLDIDYWSGLSIIPIVLLAYFFSGLYSLLNAAPFFTGNTGSLFVFAFSGLIINTLFNFLLIPVFGMIGAALSTLITYVCMAGIIYIYSQRIYKIEYDWKIILKLAALSGVIFVTGYFFINKLQLDKFIIVVINLLLICLYLLTINFLKIIELRKVSLLWKK